MSTSAARKPARFAPALARRGFQLGRGARRAHHVYAAMLLTGVAAGTMFLVVGPRSPSMSCHGGSKRELAQLTVKKYAHEAYPQWAVANPSRTCPARLSDLDEYMTSKDPNDPWGSEYRWACKDRLIAWSAGPDQTFGSDDDIGSGP